MQQVSTTTTVTVPRTQVEWREALDALPSTPQHIPAFFFAHGSPMLAYPESEQKGSLAAFLRDFGPLLLQKYQPKGIVVFSAHWETRGERLGVWSTSKIHYIVIYPTSHCCSDGLRGGKPTFNGLLWVPARLVQAQVQIQRRFCPGTSHHRALWGGFRIRFLLSSDD